MPDEQDEPAAEAPAAAGVIDEWVAWNIRLRREGLGMSQADLAKEMAALGWKYYPQTVHRVEQGQRKVTIGEAEALARIVAESERLGRALLNSVSHELRTPIAAIQSAAGGLVTDSPVQQALAGEIQEAAERLNRIVGNLLDMTRLEAGHLKARLDWCDVHDVINAALQRVEKKLAGREVTVTGPAGLPLARMDAVLMEQVLTNLLLNVALHTPAATPVQVTASVEEGAVHLSIADRGPGLPPDALDRIFDKFYRAPTAPAGGIGLGLSIVKGFVEVQGATIRAENRAGGGALFTIALPPGEPPKV